VSTEFEAIAGELGLDERYACWRDELASSAAWEDATLQPLTPAAMARACPELGIDAEAASLAVEAAAVLERSPALRRLHRHCLWRLFGSRRLPYEHDWPMLPESLGAAGRFFYLTVLVAALPRIRAQHARRGIPEQVSRETLADVGVNVRRYRALYGCHGFDEINWLGWHFQGRLFQLGRLQFMRNVFWYPVEDRSGSACPLSSLEPVLDVHVPEIGPLSPEACDDSFARAHEFFARHFPEYRYRAMTILSWLLEPRLAEVLAADSNIVRFQRRFTLLPLTAEMPGTVFKFVFHHPNQTPSIAELDALPQRTTLERAVVAHVRRGGVWNARVGYFVCEATAGRSSGSSATGTVPKLR
jgi:hypothetical protein